MRAEALIHANSSLKGPSCLSEISKPTETTPAGFSGGTSVNTRPRNVGTKPLKGNQCSSHPAHYPVGAISWP